VTTVGFVGLGNMGGALAANLVAAGHQLVGYDSAGPRRCPEGADAAADVAEVARRAEVVVLSLPDGSASQHVAGEIAGASGRLATHIIDTSTIGVSAAVEISKVLADAGIGYVDAPVSGGVAGARARTLVVMYAGSEEACEVAEPVLAGMTDRRLRVGGRPGLAQALKLANNFLSATALAATSEAVAFGLSVGLEMGTMLQVLNAGSGQSAATSDKFPNQVLTGRYAAGFTNSLMIKDLNLYLREVGQYGGPATLGAVTASIWAKFADSEPGVDFTRIFPFVQEGSQ
jgi:3-hydroxyisobutyrate dehydrogenase-like beta-hydroxyacid dehydrogenase